MNSKRIIVTSEFPASTGEIWTKLQKLETLQYIAAPYAYFNPIGSPEMIWMEGHTFRFELKLFRIINMGIHTIDVALFDKETLTVYTKERNKSVPVWNHKIVLKKIGENKTRYTDEVEIFAGWKTAFVCIWSKLFYRHRQKKWLELLCG